MLINNNFCAIFFFSHFKRFKVQFLKVNEEKKQKYRGWKMLQETKSHGDRVHNFCCFFFSTVTCCWETSDQDGQESTRFRSCWRTGVCVHSQSVLHHHGLRGCREKKKPLLRMQHLKAQLKFAADHVDKEKTVWRRTLRSDETKSLATVSSSMFREWGL